MLFQKFTFTTVFELKAESKAANVYRPTAADLENSRLAKIARYVAATGQVSAIDHCRVYLYSKLKFLPIITMLKLCFLWDVVAARVN